MEIEEWNSFIETWLNSSERRAIEIIARSVGIFTILGAGYIIQDITKDAARRKRTKNRIMLFMSISDLMAAFFGSVLGTLMVPEWTGVPGAMGNQLSCDIQGFFAYASGLASGMFNVSLALCYLLMVRHEYSDERLHELESYFLYTPLVLSIIIAIPGLPFRIYNFYGVYSCHPNASPLNCDQAQSPIECERGELYKYWWYVNSANFLTGVCIIITCMAKMYTTVLNRERGGDQFRFSPTASNIQRRTLSNAMRSQGLWYSGAFLFSFFPLIVSYFLESYIVAVFSALALNSLGFTNALIYVRPRFLKFRRDYPNVGIVSSIWQTLFRTLPARRQEHHDMTHRKETTNDGTGVQTHQGTCIQDN
jgi:cytochrome bd-type quinol oxidase subunit 2